MSFSCQNINKRFGNIIALKNACLSIEPGEVRALLGGNGSGKSTLAKILSGALHKDNGDITFLEKPYKVKSPTFAIREGIVATSQELSFLNNLTVEENLLLRKLPVKGIFVNRKQMREKAHAVMQSLDLLPLLNKEISELASNEQYLVEFAKALVLEPKILILDEITSALYAKDVEIVFKTIRELKQEGCSIIFISHRMREIFEICDTVTVMRNGETVETFDISNVDEHMLLLSMTGKEILETKKVKTEDATQKENGKVVFSINDMKLCGFDNQINLDISEGCIVGIAGLQGHGQSTLLRQIFGLHKPVEIVLDGKKTLIKNPRQAIKNGIAFLSGNRELEGTFSDRSILENLYIVNKLILKRKNNSALDTLQKYNTVYSTTDQEIRQLSGGNQQKVVIGRWTSTNPKVLLADDLTKGIDVQARLDVHGILMDLAEKGTVVLIVSSDEEELVNITTQAPNAMILVMYEGEVFRILKGQEITGDNIKVSSLGIRKGNV